MNGAAFERLYCTEHYHPVVRTASMRILNSVPNLKAG
jgi:hypothetical protein